MVPESRDVAQEKERSIPFHVVDLPTNLPPDNSLSLADRFANRQVCCGSLISDHC
jgi:hypothetical protein